VREGRKLTIAFTAALLGALGAAPGAWSSPGFTNFELGADHVGQTCPSSSAAAEAACTNFASEPAIRADGDGNFYASSENSLGFGTDAWKSPRAANGASYTYLGMPNAVSSSNNTGLAPGGGDTDLAVAPARNATGLYNVYVASLSGVNVDVSTSTDGGKTFSFNPVGALIPVDDREWIAADGASKVCVAYHDPASNLDVNCSSDAGTSFTQLGSAFDSSHAYLINNNEIGNLAIDPRNHNVYQTFSGVGSPAGALTENFHVVYMAVSTDGGKTFTDHVVYDNPDTSVGYGHQFVNVSLDQAGNLYSVYSDDHNLYYSFSTDHGTTWKGPYRINSGPAATAIFPWSVAGNAGKLAVVYYGSSYYDGKNPPDNYPAKANWYAYYAENDSVLTRPGGFSQTQATPVVHSGGVCESGVTCTGNRDLFDDFGLAVSPLTDAASIVYSDDQYRGFANNPPPSGCTSDQSNQLACDHTNAATGRSAIFSSSATGGRGSGRGPSLASGGQQGGRAGVIEELRRAAGSVRPIGASG
jgi:hypothetical protein